MGLETCSGVKAKGSSLPRGAVPQCLGSFPDPKPPARSSGAAGSAARANGNLGSRPLEPKARAKSIGDISVTAGSCPKPLFILQFPRRHFSMQIPRRGGRQLSFWGFYFQPRNKNLSQRRGAAPEERALLLRRPLGTSPDEGWDENIVRRDGEELRVPSGEEKGEAHYLIPLQQN